MSRCGLHYLIVLIAFPFNAWPCSYCDASFSRKKSLREEAVAADYILLGTASNARLIEGNAGTTDFAVVAVLKKPEDFKFPSAFALPRFIRIDPKGSNSFIVFARREKGAFDAYRIQEAGDEAAKYLKKSLELSADDHKRQLLFYSAYLGVTDATVASDAYLEFAKASDADIRSLQKSLPVESLRKLIASPKTPPERLSLFCYLLGQAGRQTDFDFLRNCLEKEPAQYRLAIAGLLSGMVEIAPEAGWKYLKSYALRKENTHADQLAVLNLLRFFRTARPDDFRSRVLPLMKEQFDRGDFADLIVEDWRQWKIADYSTDIAAKYGAKTHSYPLAKRAILRYALTVRDEPSLKLLAEVKKTNGDLIEEIEAAIK